MLHKETYMFIAMFNNILVRQNNFITMTSNFCLRLRLYIKQCIFFKYFPSASLKTFHCIFLIFYAVWNFTCIFLSCVIFSSTFCLRFYKIWTMQKSFALPEQLNLVEFLTRVSWKKGFLYRYQYRVLEKVASDYMRRCN